MMIERIKKWWRKQVVECSGSWVEVDTDYYRYIQSKKPEAWLAVKQPFRVYKNVNSGDEVAVSVMRELTTREWHWDKEPDVDTKEEFVNYYSEVFW